MIHSLLKKVIIIDKKALGRRIRAIRLQLGLTMEDFIERIDGKPGRGRSGTVNNWETGKNAPNKKRLKKIADLGGVSVEYLINGSQLSITDTRKLLDKAEDNTKLSDSELQKLRESQLDFQANTNRIAENSSREIRQSINHQRKLMSENPLSILSGYGLSDFLVTFNLVRLHGSKEQQEIFMVLLNMFRQIATGYIEYDKSDLLPNIDKLLSSFPIKKENKKD